VKLRRLRHAIAILLLVLLSTSAVHAETVTVVTTFSILADLSREVGGTRVKVESLIGADEDAHGYRPRPSDTRLIKQADMVIANGLGFDDWILRLAASANSKEPVLFASEGITPLPGDEPGHTGRDHAHRHGGHDPHAWQDVANARRYVANIAAALSRIDPAGAASYRSNAGKYDEELTRLDGDIRAAIAAIPPERRKFVMSHDALAYFGHAYGLQTFSAAGVGSEAEPSAANLAKLIRQLRREKIPVVFLENINDPRVIERIAHESGARIGGRLYTDALSPARGPASTYVDMMRHNLNTLVSGLSAGTSASKAE